MLTLKIFCFILIATYALYVLWMYKALLVARNKKVFLSEHELKISVIIAFRNEAKNIINCLESLKNQNYSANNFEIILCNDHSTDNSIQLVKEFISSNPQLRVLLIENKLAEHGKKDAVKNAVKNAQHEILAFTDADCIAGINWLKTISDAFYADKNIKMLCGPVAFIRRNNLLEKLFSLELASLIGATAATIQNNKAIMCNAANMAVLRDAYNSMFEHALNKKYASGDDVFLLHGIKKCFGEKSIAFNFNKDALILTHTPQNVETFIQQRIRWSSKTVGYSDSFALFSASLVFIVCLTIASGLFFSFFYGKLASLFIALFLIKTLVDVLLLHQILKLIQREELIKWIVIEQLLYVFYVPFIAIVSLKKTYVWKGRRLR
jgi:cellulose synthase/poly-beta-1,6-N-acetylglucosamine synthase-like glycosyltransferase